MLEPFITFTETDGDTISLPRSSVLTIRVFGSRVKLLYTLSGDYADRKQIIIKESLEEALAILNQTNQKETYEQ